MIVRRGLTVDVSSSLRFTEPFVLFYFEICYVALLSRFSISPRVYASIMLQKNYLLELNPSSSKLVQVELQEETNTEPYVFDP